MTASTLEIVREIVAEQLGIRPAAVADNVSIRLAFGADSLDEIEIITAIEREFEINIEDSASDRSHYTVTDIADEVAGLKHRRAA